MLRFTALARLSAVILALFLVLPASGQSRSPLVTFSTEKLVIRSDSGERKFSVEVARTGAQHAQGLMYRRRLAPDAGMLFVYRRVAPIAMWMKNTYIPLDMLFLDAEGRILHLVERTVPFSLETISSGQPALAVLEVNAGTVRRLKLKRGDRVIAPSLGK